jgi:hypothetical protein
LCKKLPKMKNYRAIVLCSARRRILSGLQKPFHFFEELIDNKIV